MGIGEEDIVAKITGENDDAEAAYAELSSRGLPLSPPNLTDYGMKQLFVPEPDGYSLCFESPEMVQG